MGCPSAEAFRHAICQTLRRLCFINIIASPVFARFSDGFPIPHSKPFSGAIVLCMPTTRLVNFGHSREAGTPKVASDLYGDASISFLTHSSSPPRAMISCTFGLINVSESYKGIQRWKPAYGSAPTLSLHTLPSLSLIVMVDRATSHVKYQPLQAFVSHHSEIEKSCSCWLFECGLPTQFSVQTWDRVGELAYVRRVSFFSCAGVTCGEGGGESRDSRFRLGS